MTQTDESRLAAIEAELKTLRRRRTKLLREKRQLEVKKVYSPMSRFWDDFVLEIIKQNPGCSRDTVRTSLSRPITERELTNVLTTLRRRGSITNRGTRNTPEWHIVDPEIPS